MKITEFYRPGKPAFSFEFFPPKSAEGERKLFETVSHLKELQPSFVSVTYGAMGTSQSNTIGIVEHIKEKIEIEAAAHLTCISHTQAQIDVILHELHEKGVENIVALRGDMPQNEPGFKTPKSGFRYACELVDFIRRHPLGHTFALAVAGYPEGHIECPDKNKDLRHLKEKVDAGADAVITQLFFNNNDYFDFVDRACAIGIGVPIIPGIMPVTNGAQIKRFAQMCGASIPREMKEAIDSHHDHQSAIEAYGINFATKQCRELLAHKVPGIHFYTLNKSHATREIYQNLGLAKK